MAVTVEDILTGELNNANIIYEENGIKDVVISMNYDDNEKYAKDYVRTTIDFLNNKNGIKYIILDNKK